MQPELAPTLDSAPPRIESAATVAGAPQAWTPLPTAQSSERYQVGATLGRGGMGRVVRARDLRLQRDVAIKELDGACDDATRTRFLREVQLAAELAHPNIVPIYDIRDDAVGLAYSMRLIEGTNLADALAACPDHAARIRLLPRVRDVCNAVAFAHERGVIHRDIKPHNVMLGAHGDSLLVDWGLAKRIDAPDAPTRDSASERVDVTVEGGYLGTPLYMSPEQVAGQPATRQSDVWSLGVVLYELLTGQAPFGGQTVAGVFDAITHARVVPPRVRCNDVSPELESICLKALAHAPHERYADAGEMVRDLDAAIAGRLVGARTYRARDLVRRFLRKHRATVAMAALAIVALAVVGTWSIVRIRSERASALKQRDYASAILGDQMAFLSNREVLEKVPDYFAQLEQWAKRTVDFYDALEPTFELRSRRANALYSLCDAAGSVGEAARGVPYCRSAVGAFEQLWPLARTLEQQQSVRVALARAWGSVAHSETIAGEQLGDAAFDAAEAQAWRAIGMSPRDPIGHRVLLRILYERLDLTSHDARAPLAERLERAWALAQALGMHDLDAEVAQALGYSALVVGDLPRAERFMARAVELATDDESSHMAHADHAQLLLGMGQPAAARDELALARAAADREVQRDDTLLNRRNRAVAVERQALAALALGDLARADALLAENDALHTGRLTLEPTTEAVQDLIVTLNQRLRIARTRGDVRAAKLHAHRIIGVLAPVTRNETFPILPLAEAELELAAPTAEATFDAAALRSPRAAVSLAASLGRSDLVARVVPAPGPDPVDALARVLGALAADDGTTARVHAQQVVEGLPGTIYPLALDWFPELDTRSFPARWQPVVADLDRCRVYRCDLAVVLAPLLVR